MSRELSTRRGNQIAVIERQLADLDVLFDVSSKLGRIRFGLPTAPPEAEWPALFAKAIDMVATGTIARTGKALAAASRPADLAETARSIATLIGAYPTVQRSELAVFAELLTSDILETGASGHAIAVACKRLRQTSKYLPAISEVVAMTMELNGRLLSGRRTVDDFEGDLEQARRMLPTEHVKTPEDRARVLAAGERLRKRLKKGD